MRIFGISDLHLSFTSNKPMDKFGPHWQRHHEKIAASWKEQVSEGDVVLIPGDHSWALKLEEAVPDLAWIADLPGTKIMGKGNHDLWWHSLARLEALRLPGMRWLQNNAFLLEGVGICGTRGWSLPGPEAAPDDLKIYAREQERLKLSLAALEQLEKKAGERARMRICMLHYPPLLSDRLDTELTGILEGAGIDLCIYGHMHLSHRWRVFRGTHQDVRYEVVSCDFADFAPRELIIPASA